MTTVHPLRPAHERGPDDGGTCDGAAVAGTDALLEALSRREPVSTADPAIALLAALVDDVDQRRSSVSITPST
ncbi:anti-sigma-D factor RsdA [Streptosporangium sandarakinum]|uniref:anti-sigma-D factor RsdA n=1 Tax=Streptosporangium sandarakinum TaxID=1260955 RepID=UPI0033B61B98